MNVISYFRTTFIRQLTCGVLLFHFVNFSIDTHDYTNPLEQTWHINEIESVVEFMCEEVLDMGDILPESDDDDKTSGKSAMKSIILPDDSVISIQFFNPGKTIINFASRFFRSLNLKINTPPPR